MFLGTPHRGSGKAAYGKVLSNIATSVLNKPLSCLINALQVNSKALMRLTTDFRSQLPKYLLRNEADESTFSLGKQIDDAVLTIREAGLYAANLFTPEIQPFQAENCSHPFW